MSGNAAPQLLPGTMQRAAITWAARAELHWADNEFTDCLWTRGS